MRNIKNIALFVLMPALLSTAAVADIHYVNPGDSIQAAIDAADPGDEIEVAPGTYTEAIDFIGKAIRLYSSSGPDVTTIDGTGHYHVVQCISGEGSATVLEGFTITGGNANGTGDDRFGGGMYNDISSPTVTNCTFEYNESFVFGGGMYNKESNPAVTNCTFTSNTGHYGGGMGNYNGSPTVTDCTFTSNTGNHGGGMFNYGNSNPTVTNCTFTGNTAEHYGGGMYNYDNANPTVTNCTFTGNNAYYGGGMHNFKNSDPTLTNCTFSGNTADLGGGMYNYYNSTPTVTNCTFTENTASVDGGGMYNEVESNPTVTDCTFTSNTGDYGGGMCNIFNSNPIVTNCKFTENTASVDGGGMYNDWSSPTVTNCTFTVNTASQGGGMYNLDSSTPTLANCILWDDSPDEIFDEPDSSTTVTYSDVQGGWAGAGNFDICPLFADADRRLSPYSPCIDAGNDAAVPPGVTTDLDGNPRIQGVCVDMGAFESEFIVIDFSGWVWMETYNDFSYSYNEDDLLYFLSFGHVWYYNITIGQWLISKPMGWVFVDWPYLYVLDTNALVFVLPPESGFWVYHFRPGQWTVSPRIIP